MKALRGLLLLIVLASLLFIIRPDDSIAQSFVQRAGQLRVSGDYRSAQDYLQLALTRQPWNATLHYELAGVAARQRQFSTAQQALVEAEQLGADQVLLERARAEIAEQQHQFESAARHWQNVIAARPDDQTADQRSINAFIDAENWDAARLAAEQWLVRQPDSPEAHLVLAKTIAVDDPTGARQQLALAPADQARDFSSALEQPERALRSLLLGRAYLAQNDLTLAQRAFDDALQANHSYAEAYAYAGFVRDQRGQDGTAWLDQAVELDQHLEIARYFRARHLWQHGDLAGALNDLQVAIDHDPANALLAAEIGRVYVQRSDFVNAEQWLTKARDLKPADHEIWKSLAELYIGRSYGTPAQWVATAQQIVQQAPQDADSYVWLGRAYLLSGDRDNAERELRLALQLNPQSAAAHFYLGRLFGRDTEDGRAAYERARLLDPDGPIGTAARRALELP